MLGIITFFVIVASMCVYFLIFHTSSVSKGLRTFFSVMAPIIYGLTIAFLLNPFVRFVEEQLIGSVLLKLKIKPGERARKILRWICVIVILIVFLFLIYLLLAAVIPQLLTSIMSLIYNIPSYADTITRWLQGFMEDGLVEEDFLETFNQGYAAVEDYLTTNIVPQIQNMLKNITTGVFDVITFVRNFLVGSLFSLYVMAARETLTAKAKMITYAILPLKWADITIRSMRFTGNTFSGFISGKIIDSAIIGAICYVSCTVMEMPYTMLISVVIGVTNIIPFFGPFLGAIPSLLLILLVDPIKCLYFLIFILILQQFDGNVLGPKILGDSTGLSSLMVIVSIIVCSGFFGAVGMLVGVPAFAVLSAGFEYLTKRSLGLRELPTNIDTYIGMDRLNPEDGSPIAFHTMEDGRRKVLSAPPQKPSLVSRIFMFFWNAATGFIISVCKFVIGLITMTVNNTKEQINQYKKRHPKIKKPGKLTFRERMSARKQKKEQK